MDYKSHTIRLTSASFHITYTLQFFSVNKYSGPISTNYNAYTFSKIKAIHHYSHDLLKILGVI